MKITKEGGTVAEKIMKIKQEVLGPAARTIQEEMPRQEGGRAAKKEPRCQFCDKEVLLRPMWCSICKQAFYCDKECQGMDWKKHKKTCKAPGDAK